MTADAPAQNTGTSDAATSDAATQDATEPDGQGGPARQRGAGWALPARDFVAIALAGAGTLLLFISLLVDWRRVVLPDPSDPLRLDAGIGDIPTWGTAYVVGSMLLVALFVGVVVLPVHLGRAARVLGIAWAITVAGVVTAAAVRLAERPGDLAQGLVGGMLAGVVQADDVRSSWGPGGYVAAAGLLAMVSAFAAACPSLRDTDDKLAP